MTVETVECNGMQESAGAEFEGKSVPESVAREGEERPGECNSIACGEAEDTSEVAKDDVDGSYVIVNGESDELSEKDLDVVEKVDLDGNQRAEPGVELDDPSEGDLGVDSKVEIRTTDVEGCSVEISALTPTADAVLEGRRAECSESSDQSEGKGDLVSSLDQLKCEEKGALTLENGYNSKRTSVSNSDLDVGVPVVQEETLVSDKIEERSVPRPVSVIENEKSGQEQGCEESFGDTIGNHDGFEGETPVNGMAEDQEVCESLAATSFEIKDKDSEPVVTETAGSISPSHVTGKEMMSFYAEDRIPAEEQSEVVVSLTHKSESLPRVGEEMSASNDKEENRGSESLPTRNKETLAPNDTEDIPADEQAKIACTESRSEALPLVDEETLATTGTMENPGSESLPPRDGETEDNPAEEQAKIVVTGGLESLPLVDEEALASNCMENNPATEQPKIVATVRSGRVTFPLGGEDTFASNDIEDNPGSEQPKIVVTERSGTESLPLGDGEMLPSTEDNLVAERVKTKVMERGGSESLPLMNKEETLTSNSADKISAVEQYAQSRLEPEFEIQSRMELGDKSLEDSDVVPSTVDEVKMEAEKIDSAQESSEKQPSYPVRQSEAEGVATEVIDESLESSNTCPISDEGSVKGDMTFGDGATIELEVGKEFAESKEDVSGCTVNGTNSGTANEVTFEGKTYPSSPINQMKSDPEVVVDALENQACVSASSEVETRLEKSREVSSVIPGNDTTPVTEEEGKEGSSSSPGNDATPAAGVEGGGNVSPAPDTTPVKEGSSLIVETDKDAPHSNMDNVKLETKIGSRPVEHGESMADSIEQSQSANKDDLDTLTGAESVTERGSENEVLVAPINEAGSISLPAQKVDTDVKHQPFFMIRVPRFSDDKLKMQIQNAQQEVDEKTGSRDSVRVAMQKQKAICAEYWRKVEDARKEERVTRDAVASKRQEIDSIQSILSKLKNATSVSDIDNRIHKLQHRISHETNTLKEEKSLIREINQLKQSREHLSSSLASEVELQEAFEKQDQMETRVKHLKEEIDALRKDALRTEGNTKDAKSRYDNQCESLRALQTQFRAADDLRQEAYTKLRNLKKESYVKNEYFYSYKDDTKVATSYSFSGDKEALRRHCNDQIEKIMELWNKNDEFRHQYVKANMASTLRRFRTLDGRSLGPDEEPTIIHSPMEQKENAISPPVLRNDNPVLATERKQEIAEAPLSAAKMNSTNGPALVQKSQPQKSKKVTKPAPPEVVSVRELDKEAEKETKRSMAKEEQARKAQEQLRKAEEQARKEEELRKEEAANLKEQLRLDQIAKAKEAEERKKRKAEKAQAKAELKAQKEAELKEKKKEKKEKKKERKSTATTRENIGEAESPAPHAESETPPESGFQEQPEKTAGVPSKRSSKPRAASTKEYSKVKPLPPPLRNRGKRKMQTWMWVLLTALLVLALFMAGNHVSFSKFGLRNLSI